MKELRGERTREIPLGPGFVSGDVVGIEMGSLRHRADLREVFAVFDDGPGDGWYPLHEITLRGRPQRATQQTTQRTLLRRRHSSGAGMLSRVILSGIVPTGAAPGEYRCRRLEAETHTGRRVPFDPVTEAEWRGWRFRVL